jgi:hypothetical protein
MKSFSKVLRVSLAMILMMGWTGCGGSSGGGGDGPDSQTDQALKIVELENENANEFASQSILYFDAVEEYFEELEAGTSGIDLTGMTVDDLVAILGQEQVDILADKILSIYSNKIEPAAKAMDTAYNDLVLSEQEYEDYLNPGAASMVQPAGLVTGTVLCAAGGILLTGMGTILYCVNEVIKENQACIKMRMDEGKTKAIATLACTLQFREAIKNCSIDIATSAYTTALSAGAGGYKIIQFLIDTYSGVDSAIKIKTVIGERGCSTNQGFVGQSTNDSWTDVAIAPKPDASYFIGIGEEGLFTVPEGDWKFMVVADGYARGLTGCVNVYGDGEIIDESVTMVPSDKVKELGSDQDGDGYTVCQSDCDDENDLIYPGAVEICDDLIDNDCNDEVDCDDSLCVNDPACEEIETWYVWYVDNIGLKPVMVGTNESFEADRLCSSYPGGGTSPTTLMDKVAIVEAYATRESATEAACSQFTNIRAVPASSTFIWTDWLADLGGERHDIDELGGCQ